MRSILNRQCNTRTKTHYPSPVSASSRTRPAGEIHEIKFRTRVQFQTLPTACPLAVLELSKKRHPKRMLFP